MTTENNLKSMLCGYCASISFEDNGKCKTCEYNPIFHDNFELSKSAELMMDEGVLTHDGAVNMVGKLNATRFARIADIFMAEGEHDNS